VTAAHNDVLAQYESVFARMGWTAGLILPRHMGEAQWLMWDQTPGDKLLVSANRSGFTSVTRTTYVGLSSRTEIILGTPLRLPRTDSVMMLPFAIFRVTSVFSTSWT